MPETATPQLLKTVEFPLRLVSEANQREHWRKRLLRKLTQQNVVRMEMKRALRNVPDHPHESTIIVRLTRIGPRLMDPDNNVGSFKHVQDAIADGLGVDDGNTDAVRWEYAQAKGKTYAVRIEFFAAPAEGGTK